MATGSKARRVMGIGLAVVVAVFLTLAWVPVWVVDALAAAFPAVVWKAETGQPQAAITFDDGPHPVYTPQVLDILKRHNARATFFLVGQHARRYPEIVERIRAEGHEVANHTDSRRNTIRMDAESFVRSLEAAEATLKLGDTSASPAGSGNGPAPRLKLMRPAGGLIRPEQLAAARERGYTVVLGSAYGWDGRTAPPAGYLRWVISKNLEPGAIVVMHDYGRRAGNSIAALDGILAAGQRQGLKWVTLSELLNAKN